MKEIQTYQEQIARLCEQHQVRSLYAFGSVLSDHFSDESDVDFLVRFDVKDLSGYFENFLSFKAALENLLKRRVDLLEEQTLKNPVLKRSIDRQKELLYG